MNDLWKQPGRTRTEAIEEAGHRARLGLATL